MRAATPRTGELGDAADVAGGRSRPAAPDAFTPPPGNPRFPLFDSLRAIAALSIVMVHVIPLSGALDGSRFRGLVAHLDIGVTIFFLVSGFLLYRPFLTARILGAPASRHRDYAWRRFLRIAPAYWFALTALAVVPGLYGVFTGNWWVYYGLLQNYPIYTQGADCAPDILRCGIDPAWSLGVEVAFYALLPLFAFAMASLNGRLRTSTWLMTELGVLGLVGALSVPVVLGLGTEPAWLTFSPLAFGWWFALGMALAALSVREQQRGAEGARNLGGRFRTWHAWAAAGLLYALLSLVLVDPLPGRFVSAGQYLAEYLLFGVIAVLVVAPAVFSRGRPGLPHRVLANPVLSWLGLISYGIFLWHFPITYALFRGGVTEWWPPMALPILAVLTLAITIACATISYYLVERPLLRLKHGIRSQSRQPPPLAQRVPR